MWNVWLDLYHLLLSQFASTDEMIITAEQRASLYGCVRGILDQCAHDFDAADAVSGAVHAVYAVLSDACADFSEDWNARQPRALAQRLPPEIVSLFFRRLRLRDLVRATHVSRHWRSLAIADPHLWSRFGTSQGLTATSLTRLRVMLQRSQPLPFDLGMTKVFCPKSDFLSVLEPHIGRMQRFDGQLRVFQQALREDPPMPHLTWLLEDAQSRDNQFSIPDSWASGGAPRLHTLELGLFTLPPPLCCFANIEVLSGRVTALGTEILRQLFQYFPKLATLELYSLNAAVSLPELPFPPFLRQVGLNQRTAYWTTKVPGLDYSRLLSAWVGATLPSLVVNDTLSAAAPVDMFLTAHRSGPVEAILMSNTLSLAVGDSDCAVYGPEDTDVFPRLLSELAPPLLTRISELLISPDILGSFVEKSFELPQLNILKLHTKGYDKPGRGSPSGSLRAPALRSVAISVYAHAGYGGRLSLTYLVRDELPRLRSWLVYDAAVLDNVSIIGPPDVLDAVDLDIDLSGIAASIDVTYSSTVYI